MSLQAALDFSRDLAEQGMAQTLEAETAEWLAEALEALQVFASKPEWSEFKLEDFRYWWLLNGGTEPHTHHVFGALTNKAQRLGIIKFSGKFAPSVSPKTHGHWVRVWRG
jgi:hypothetical protein